MIINDNLKDNNDENNNLLYFKQYKSSIESNIFINHKENSTFTPLNDLKKRKKENYSFYNDKENKINGTQEKKEEKSIIIDLENNENLYLNNNNQQELTKKYLFLFIYNIIYILKKIF